MVCPSGGEVFYSNFNYHLGSAYIIACLREHGFSAEQFISDESFNVRECAKKILSYNPKIVGFSVYESNYMQCVLISNLLRDYSSDIIIIFGGPTPTFQSREILECVSSIDLCVRREGEEIILGLVSVLSENHFKLDQVDLYKIKGITFRKGDLIIENPESDILFSNRHVKNYLDKYPSPYLSKVIPTPKAILTGIITARGCNQNCTFCNCSALSNRNIFLHSTERVIEELAYLSEYKKFLVPVPIYDDGFTIIPSRAIKICEAIVENNIKLPLLCITRCDKITEEMLDLMKQAGFVSVGFSLESAVPKVLRAIGKVNPPENIASGNFNKERGYIDKLKSMTSYAKKIGMERVFLSVMIGLPGETRQDALKTIEFVKQLNIDFYSHNFLHIYKGTPLYQNYGEYGYKIKSVGNKNKILLNNNFPFDVYKINHASTSKNLQNSRIVDYDTLKILSLNPKRAEPKSYFNNVIINGNFIKSPMVSWIQENLAINGAIIQLYTSKSNCLKFHEKNESLLFDEFCPTKNYEGYYCENLDGDTILKSRRMALYDEDIGLPSKLKNTYMALEEYRRGYNNMESTICQECNVSDASSLYNLLVEVSKSDNSFNYLLERKFLPQFQTLCKWTGNQANCRKLETAIIGDDGSVRICWNGDSLGTIYNSFSDIERNLHELNIESLENRNCISCQKHETCIKCLFPYPLSSDAYCDYKKQNDTNDPAKYVFVVGVLKDFLFKPLNVYDF
jgi:radical SAM superfamily enzyme YgiQ (UPF0313 family)